MAARFGKYIAALIICLTCTIAEGNHIVGSEAFYECRSQSTNLRTTTFRVTMVLFRDRNEIAPLDPTIDVGIFRRANSNVPYQNYRTTMQNLRSSSLDPINSASPCVLATGGLEVEKGYYIFDVELPWDFEYMLVYQRCCRNGAINNIVAPSEKGIALNITISRMAVQNCNNSPKFTNDPRLFICVNDNIRVDNSAKDEDGDSLVYEFCAPFLGGGQKGTNGGEDQFACDGVRPSSMRCPPPYAQVEFIGNFSVNRPITGSPAPNIDRRTGIFAGKPTISGLFLVGICVKEYRAGVLIGEVIRDFQVLVANDAQCNRVYIPFANGLDNSLEKIPILNTYVNDTIFMKACGITDVNFKNTSIIRSTVAVKYNWIYSNGSGIKIDTTYDLNVKYPAKGRYPMKLVIIPPFQECIDTLDILMDVREKLEVDFDLAIDSCKIQPWVFSNKTVSKVPIDSILWNFNGEGFSEQFAPTYEFLTSGLKNIRLFVKNSDGCLDTITKSSSYFPVPPIIDIRPDVFLACRPSIVNFRNASQFISPAYDITWDFGDGTTVKGFDASHLYNTLGKFDVKVRIKSPSNCQSERLFEDLIEVVERPSAGFDYVSENLLNGYYKLDFEDISSDGDYVKWQFGELATSAEQNPSFTFPDTGTYIILQKVFNNEGCFDTAMVEIVLRPENFVYIPDAFTPNNDLLNDEFRVVGLFRGMQSFKMLIYNRYGEEIFESNDPLNGWNGLKKNSGIPAPPDVYIYLVEYVDVAGEKILKKGNISLLR